MGKRSAPTDVKLPKAKKQYIEPKPTQKKKVPVTVKAPPSDSEQSDEEGSFGDSGENAEEDVDMEAPQKDPNASREGHKAQKLLKAQRQASKPHHPLLAQAKRVWALAHKIDIPPEERKKHVKDLADILRGNVQEIVFKHDASRIVQTLVKYGGQEERDMVANELKGRYKELVQNKYSKFLVLKLIRHSATNRASILSEFKGSILRLLLHREATSVISDAFQIHTTAAERVILLQDFYGKETSLFLADKKNLSEVLASLPDAQQKKRILNELKDNLISIFNNPDKGAVDSPLVHRALWEYLNGVNTLSDESDREKFRREILEGCQDVIAELVHTRDGSRSVRHMIAEVTAKDRKQIVKMLKPHIDKICADEDAQTVLFTALDVIDDTKMTAKSIVSEMTSLARTLSESIHGRRALLYLLVPRDPRHFPPDKFGALLAETDAARSRTSKKDEATRRTEIRVAASPVLLDELVVKGDAAENLARDPGGSLLLTDVLLYAESDKTAAFEALLRPLAVPYLSRTTEDAPECLHIIEIPHSSRLYKTLLQGGHFSHSTKAVITVPSFSAVEFASAFLRHVSKENIVSMASDGMGTFVVAELCERVHAEGSKEEKQMLTRYFPEKVRMRIRESEIRGKAVLLHSLQRLNDD